MTTANIIVLIVVIAACVGAIILLYFMGKRNMKKRDEQQAAIDQAAQWVNMLIIDKKKLRMKESGLPQQVIDQTPRFARLAKVFSGISAIFPFLAMKNHRFIFDRS